MTDIKLQEYRSLEGVTMDFLLKPNGMLDTSEELATAVRVALGTDRLADSSEVLPDPDSTDRRGWWGDYQAEDIWDGWPVGTKNWLLTRAKISDAISEEGDTLERARIYTLEALQPFIDRGVCSRIDVEALRTELERIEVRVLIYRGPRAEIDLRYQLLWEEETDAPDVVPPHRVVDTPVSQSSRGLTLSPTAPTVRTRWPQVLRRDLALSRFAPNVASRSKKAFPPQNNLALSRNPPTRARGRAPLPLQTNALLSTTAPSRTVSHIPVSPGRVDRILSTTAPTISVRVTPGDIATGSDIALGPTLYMGLEDGTINTYPGSPSITWSDTPTYSFDSAGLLIKSTLSPQTNLHLFAPHSLVSCRRGTIEWWVRINSGTGISEGIRFYDNSSFPLFSNGMGFGVGNTTMSFHDFYHNNWYKGDDIQSAQFTAVLGQWQHHIWTWQGARHRFYRNGVLLSEMLSSSPLPDIAWQNRFTLGFHEGFSGNDYTVRRFGIYNWAFNDADAAQAYAKSAPSPVTPTGQRGLEVDGNWGAGEGKLHVMVDAGNAYATRGNKYKVTVTRVADGGGNTPPPALLLHGEGFNGSTIILDDAGNTVTTGDNAQISTAAFKFGSSSIKFDGTLDRLNIPPSSNFTFGTGNFTIDCWIKLTPAGNTYVLIDGRGIGGDGNWVLLINNGGDIRFGALASSVLIGDTNWHHIAVTRSGTTLRLFVDGAIGASGTDTSNYIGGTSTAGVVIGCNGANSTNPLNGYLDEIRIVKGTAVWTAAFTPPTVPYVVGQATLSVGTYTGLSNGWGETIIDLGGAMATAGTYSALVELMDASNVVLSRKYVKDFYIQPNAWIGNSIGQSNAVMSPWTAITAAAQVLSCYGRSYTLTSGWGLPQQISSQGQNLFAAAPTLTFNTGSGPFSLTSPTLTLGTQTGALYTWSGTASGGGISASIAGQLDYTGLVTIDLTIQPTTTSVSVTNITLKTSMLAARALYYYGVGDQSFWSSTKKGNVPTIAGTFLNSASLEHDWTQLCPSLVVSDDDRGLEWSADNMAGWVFDALDRGIDIQTLVKESDGTVSINNIFASVAFTLSAPRTIRFYYIATPVKPLPSVWRQHANGDPLGADAKYIKWNYPGNYPRAGCWRAFSYEPEDYTTFATRMHDYDALHPPGRFTFYADIQFMAHSGLDNAGTELDMVYPEAYGGGYTQSTKGTNDYALYHYDRVVANGHAEGIYLDDPFSSGAVTANMLSAGYRRSDKSGGFGFTFAGMSDRIRRLSQMFFDRGKSESVVWMHNTGNMNVRAWRFATHCSDGEAFTFADGDPDWIDQWYNPAGTGYPWLLSIGRLRKYGFVPAFLDETKFFSGPDYIPYQRAMRCGMALMDIQPVAVGGVGDWGTYQAAKVAFGLLDTHTFNPYWTQGVITTGNANVLCSYYQATNKVLAIVGNIGSTAATFTLTFNKTTLALTGTVTALNRETGGAVTVGGTNNQIVITLAKHDYIMVEIDGH